MSKRRRKKRASGGIWPWAALAAVAAGGAVYFFSARPAVRGSIPVPGEWAGRPAPPEDSPRRSVAPAEAPREEIRKSDRDALDKVLREHAH